MPSPVIVRFPLFVRATASKPCVRVVVISNPLRSRVTVTPAGTTRVLETVTSAIRVTVSPFCTSANATSRVAYSTSPILATFAVWDSARFSVVSSANTVTAIDEMTSAIIASNQRTFVFRFLII